MEEAPLCIWNQLLVGTAVGKDSCSCGEWSHVSLFLQCDVACPRAAFGSSGRERHWGDPQVKEFQICVGQTGTPVGAYGKVSRDFASQCLPRWIQERAIVE